jgi:hypothetical protein
MNHTKRYLMSIRTTTVPVEIYNEYQSTLRGLGLDEQQALRSAIVLWLEKHIGYTLPEYLLVDGFDPLRECPFEKVERRRMTREHAKPFVPGFRLSREEFEDIDEIRKGEPWGDFMSRLVREHVENKTRKGGDE